MFRSCSEMQRFSKKAKGLTRNPAAREALDRLATIYEIVKDYGYEKYVFFDLGLLSKFHYYTGIIFQAYTYGTGEPIVKGGRYDALLQHFGKKAPAIGFCTVMESLMKCTGSARKFLFRLPIRKRCYSTRIFFSRWP